MTAKVKHKLNSRFSSELYFDVDISIEEQTRNYVASVKFFVQDTAVKHSQINGFGKSIDEAIENLIGKMNFYHS